MIHDFHYTVLYVNAHRGKTFFVMRAGEVIEHENFATIINDISLLHDLDIRLTLVYGACTQIDAKLAVYCLKPIYYKHARVTDAPPSNG